MAMCGFVNGLGAEKKVINGIKLVYRFTGWKVQMFELVNIPTF
jgi:hypothetical protein